MIKEKRGQLYIVAAIIISVILVGLFTTTNYIRIKPKDIKFYDLSKELGLESGYVIDYGLYNQNVQQDLIEDWTVKYVDYSRTHTGVGQWIFVYGNENNMTALIFTNESSGNVFISIGGETPGLTIPGGQRQSTSFIPQGDYVNVTTPDGIQYGFELNPGENFFFVISKEGYVAIPESGEEEEE